MSKEYFPAAHGVHAVAPPVEYVPNGQNVHVSAPGDPEKYPAAQDLHELASYTLLYCPAGQFVQDAAADPDHFPFGHTPHVVDKMAPVADEALPAPHELQELCPAQSWYLPASQCVHVAWPMPEYRPAGHPRQEDCPGSSAYFPAMTHRREKTTGNYIADLNDSIAAGRAGGAEAGARTGGASARDGREERGVGDEGHDSMLSSSVESTHCVQLPPVYHPDPCKNTQVEGRASQAEVSARGRRIRRTGQSLALSSAPGLVPWGSRSRSRQKGTFLSSEERARGDRGDGVAAGSLSRSARTVRARVVHRTSRAARRAAQSRGVDPTAPVEKKHEFQARRKRGRG